jgi:hypothetical protein
MSALGGDGKELHFDLQLCGDIGFAEVAAAQTASSMHARVNARERWGRARPGLSMMRASMPAYPVCIYTRILYLHDQV